MLSSEGCENEHLSENPDLRGGEIRLDSPDVLDCACKRALRPRGSECMESKGQRKGKSLPAGKAAGDKGGDGVFWDSEAVIE